MSTPEREIHDRRERALPRHPERTYLRELKRDREPDTGGRTLRQHPRLTPEQTDIVTDTGRFRVVSVRDLARVRFGGDLEATQREVSRLVRMNLVERHRVRVVGKGDLHVITLTKDGLQRARVIHYGTGQRFHGGELKKVPDIGHDAAVYRMYWYEAAELQSAGCTLRRVLLEDELKQNLWDSGDPRNPKDRARMAKDLGLKVVDGRIQIPDARIEYTRPDGEMARVDLELTTENFGPDQVRAKRAAGMKIYISGQHTPSWGRVDDPRIAAETFSL